MEEQEKLINIKEEMEDYTAWYKENWITYQNRAPVYCPYCKQEFRFVHQCKVPRGTYPLIEVI